MSNQNFADKSLKVLLVGVIILGIDFVGLGINAFRNEPIYSNYFPHTFKKDVREDLKYEKPKLGLENVLVELNFFNGMKKGYLKYNLSTKEYRVNLNLDLYSRVLLRHELCHIKSLNSSKFSRLLSFPILRQYEEWSATSCSLEN